MKQKYKMGDLIKLCSREMSFPKFIVEKPQKYWWRGSSLNEKTSQKPVHQYSHNIIKYKEIWQVIGFVQHIHILRDLQGHQIQTISMLTLKVNIKNY